MRKTSLARLQRRSPHGVAIDPKHNEVFITDNNINGIITYYFPEMF